jgi:hypothetical protein
MSVRIVETNTMAVNSTFSFGGYSLFRRESAIDVASVSPIMIHGSHLNYWLALGFVLFSAFLIKSGRRKHAGVDVPFYKASKMKWMFDAENLVRDSYNKVLGQAHFYPDPAIC